MKRRGIGWGLLAAATAMALSVPAYADITEGTLWTERGKKIVDVPLSHTEVRIDISGYLAAVTVEQTFVNPFPDKIEAIYAFPLPTGAAVDSLVLTTGDEVIRGSLHRRAEAKRIYKVAKEAGRVAALLEEERLNLFTQSVANIEPGATIKVAIHFFQELPYDDGAYELVFPLVASPRYVPAGKKKAAGSAGAPRYLPPETRSSHDVGLTVNLDAGVAVRDLRSPSHAVAFDRSSPSRARITIVGADTIPNKDFVLRYEVAGDRPEAALLAHRSTSGEPGSFFLMVHPPKVAAGTEAAPRELVFVVDTSSSMAGPSLAKAKEVIRTSLASLRPDDTFQIVRFSDSASALGPSPIANRPANVALALRWLDGLAATGGTEMIDGIRAALDFPHDPARLRMVLFLTDGYIGNEEEVLATVRERLGASRIFSFGVGTAVNRYLLEEMAALGRGTVTVARPDEDTAAAVKRFHDRIATPVLTDLVIDWKGLVVTELVPAGLPDLFVGQPLVLHGRYAAPGRATIEVHGKLAGRTVTIPTPVELPAVDTGHEAVARVWAKARIRELSRRLLVKKEPSVVEAITRLSLQHGLLTRYTAFVAVGEKVTGGGPARSVPVPLERPDGMRGGWSGSASGYGVGASGALMGTSVLSVSGSGYGGGGVGEVTIGVGKSAGFAGGAVLKALKTTADPGPGTKTLHAAPHVTMGAAVITGSLDKHLIGTVMSVRKPVFRHCYETALARTPELAGRVTLRFIIEATGYVSVASVEESEFDDSELLACLTLAIKKTVFPKHSGGGIVEVRYPFVFSKL